MNFLIKMITFECMLIDHAISHEKIRFRFQALKKFEGDFVLWPKKPPALLIVWQQTCFLEKVGLIFDPRPSHYDENDRNWIL